MSNLARAASLQAGNAGMSFKLHKDETQQVQVRNVTRCRALAVSVRRGSPTAEAQDSGEQTGDSRQLTSMRVHTPSTSILMLWAALLSFPMLKDISV